MSPYHTLLVEGDGVQHDQLGEARGLDAGGGGAREHAVGAEGEDPARALLQKHVHGLAERARSIHHVIH